MGSKSSKSNKRRHIYDELNKTIDSFNSYDDYSRSDDEIKTIKKGSNKIKKKYKLKKHKRIRKELNNELIESSLLISDFLINNIINKNVNRRQLPDTNIVNSLLLVNNFFGNDDEKVKINEQMNFCEQIINNGINNYKIEYKNSQMNKKYQNLNKDNISYDYGFKNPIKKTNRISDSKDENKSINKTEIDIYKKNPLSQKNKLEFDNNTNNINHSNNQSFASYLYKPKQVKSFINKNNNEKDKNINGINAVNSNKTKINTNTENYIRKKFVNNSPNFSLIKNKDKENVINLSNLDNKKKNLNDINNIRIYNKKNKKYARNNNIYLNKENNISADNIKHKPINEIIKQKEIKQIKENNSRLNKTQDIIKNKKENFNDINKIEKSTNFNFINNNNINNIKPYNNFNNKIEKSYNFNISNNTNIKNKNNIEFESEYRKSKLFLNEEFNNNEKFLDNLNKSSLKDFVNKQAQKIRQSPDYIKNKKLEIKKENTNILKQMNGNNYIKNNISYINNNKIYNLNNISNTMINKSGFQNKKNIIRNKKNSKNKNISKKNIITIDLRNALSNGKNKKK